MAKPRMDLSAFVGKLLEEQDGDVLREGIRVHASNDERPRAESNVVDRAASSAILLGRARGERHGVPSNRSIGGSGTASHT